MTNFDWERFDVLAEKIEKLGNTVLLPPAELAEWRKLNAQVDEEARLFQAREEAAYNQGQLAAMLGESEWPDTVGPLTDAAW